MIGDPIFAKQQEALIPILSGLDLPDEPTVLDLGCGWGRMYDVLAEARASDVRYEGVDLDPQRIAWAAEQRPHAEWWNEDILTFLRESDIPSWDLVMAAEVLMHIPPEDIEAVVSSIKRRVGRYLVTVNWEVPMDVPVDADNHLHDYTSLLPGSTVYRAGPWQRIRVWRPDNEGTA